MVVSDKSYLSVTGNSLSLRPPSFSSPHRCASSNSFSNDLVISPLLRCEYSVDPQSISVGGPLTTRRAGWRGRNDKTVLARQSMMSGFGRRMTAKTAATAKATATATATRATESASSKSTSSSDGSVVIFVGHRHTRARHNANYVICAAGSALSFRTCFDLQKHTHTHTHGHVWLGRRSEWPSLSLGRVPSAGRLSRRVSAENAKTYGV